MRRQKKSVLAFTGVAILLISACHNPHNPPSPEISIQHEVTPQPAHVGPATITLRLSDSSQNAVSGAQITLEGNMSHPGMAPTFGKAKEIAPGQYQAPFEFTMGGDWVVLVHLTLPDGQKLERQFEMRGVGSD